MTCRAVLAYVRYAARKSNDLLNPKLETGGKPSTWFPPEGLIEQSSRVRAPGIQISHAVPFCRLTMNFAKKTVSDFSSINISQFVTLPRGHIFTGAIDRHPV